MKQIFRNINKHINTRATRSIALGLVLALTLGFVSSSISNAATSSTVVPFVEGSAGLVTRLGSLAVGSAVVPLWMDSTEPFTNPNVKRECIGIDNITTMEFTCLDVVGGANFANLLVRQTAYFTKNTVVGPTSSISGPDGGSPGQTFSVDNSTLTIEDVPTPTPSGFETLKGFRSPNHIG